MASLFKGLQKKPLPSAGTKQRVKSVLTAKQLLTGEKREEHLKSIKSLLNLPPKLYDSLYYKAIEHFVEFVQELPDTGTFLRSSTFLDHGIERAARALSLCLTYFFPEEKTLQNISSQQALWIYAVFSAALLLDIGKLAVKYQVDIANKEGVKIKEWLPYSGPLTAQGKFYIYSISKENRDYLRRLVTGLLARQLLTYPEPATEGKTTIGGFNWIASNPEVLEAWLSIMQGEGKPVGFLRVIPMAEAEILRQRIARQHTDFNADETLPPLENAKAFLEWLQNSLGQDTITVNKTDSFIHSVPEGILITQDAFKAFAEEHKLSNPEAIEREFRQFTEIYQISIDNITQRYGHIAGGTFHQLKERFLVINNPYLLYVTGQKPPASLSQIVLPQTREAADTPLPPTTAAAPVKRYEPLQPR